MNALTKILSKLRHILLNIIEINTEWERVRNDQGVSPENRRKRNVPTAEIFSNLPRDEINQICVASIGGAVSDYLLESGREDTLTKFKQIFCKCISGVLRVSNVYKKKKWIKCMNCPLDPVINKYTLQVLNRHFNECLQGKFKTILAANQDEWQICRGVFGKTKEFWELDSGFYFEGQCPAVEERVINSIKTYLTSGSWSTIERQTLLPPSYIDESYGALETSNPCMESLSEIENRGNLTWDEVEELRLRKDNSYYECSNSLPRSTRSPNNVNLGQSDNEDNGAGSSTQSPIKLSKLALLKGENNKLEANDLFFFEILINSQIREFVTLAEKLENFIFNLQNTFERAKLEREFINIKDFKLALKDNNINKIIFLNITHTMILKRGEVFYKAIPVRFCRLNLCLGLEKSHAWNVYINEIDHESGDYKYCKKISFVNKFKTCEELGKNPKCSFASIEDDECIFVRKGFIDKYRVSNNKGFSTEGNELMENIGEDIITYNNIVLYPTNEMEGNFKRIYKFHITKEQIACATHLINIGGMHLFNIYILKSTHLTSSLLLSAGISMFWLTFFAVRLINCIYGMAEKRLERAERKNLEYLRKEKLKMRKLKDSQKDIILE